MDEEPVAVVALGDPESPATWSGTPYNMLQALRRRGGAVTPVATKLTTSQRVRSLARYELAKVLARPIRPSSLHAALKTLRKDERSDYLRTRLTRRYLGAQAHRGAQAAGARKLLHIGGGGYTIPRGPIYKNYLVCDNTWHTTSATRPPDPFRFPADFSDRFEELEKDTYERVTHFLPLSRYVSEDLQQHYGVPRSAITVVGTGRGQMAPNSTRKDYTEKRLLFAAKVRFHDKGGPLLLEAFRFAREADPGITLTVVGDPRLTLPPHPGLTVRGHVSSKELEQLFHSASLFAMPALWEPWGLVYLEALASRTPILGLNRNAFPELAGDGEFGYIVAEPEPRAIAAAIVGALNEPGELEGKATAGQRHVLEHYSWDKTAARIERALTANVA